MKKLEETINLNGEFLGISALAIYSAPWFLQIPLLLLVALLFFVKVSRYSKEIRKFTERTIDEAGDEIDEVLSEINYLFFGFAVPGRNVAAYWVGFLIYLVTLIYALANTYINVSA